VKCSEFTKVNKVFSFYLHCER